MTHPDQLFIPFTGPRIEMEIPKANIADLKDWREGDLLDMLELVCELIKANDDPQALLHKANELRLPSSLTTLLMNSVNRLEGLLLVKGDDSRPRVSPIGLPNVATLAKEIGLGGVFTREVESIWKAPKESESITPIIEQPIVIAEQAVAVIEQQAPSTLAITTVRTATGRQWKIAGHLISEVVEVQGLGHVGKLYSGDHVTQLKPLRDYEPAASQCRSHAEGVLKLLKLVPR